MAGDVLAPINTVGYDRLLVKSRVGQARFYCIVPADHQSLASEKSYVNHAVTLQFFVEKIHLIWLVLVDTQERW